MDLVKRLRKHASRGFPIGGEAADEIERLRARVSSLEEMGRPFAEAWRNNGGTIGGCDCDGQFDDAHFARAAELIED